MLIRKVHFVGVLAVLTALALVGQSRAADPDRRLMAKAQKFLEERDRAKACLQFANFGATYKGVETKSWSKVVDDRNRELDGYFALTVRYSWAGLLSDSEYTELVFFFNDKGRFYAVDDAAIGVKPVRPGGPPIYIAGQADVSVRRAARIGDAWLIVNTSGLSKVTALMQTYRAALKEYGRTPMEFPVTIECYVGERHATAHEEWRGFVQRAAEL